MAKGIFTRMGLIGALAVACCGCLGSTAPPLTSPAPLAQTKIDDTALIAADKAFDAALSGIDVARDICAKTRSTNAVCARLATGSPTAVRLAGYIRRVNAALQAAFHAAEAGHVTSYKAALAEAQAAITAFKAAINGSG